MLEHNVTVLSEKLVEAIDIINRLHGYVERTDGTLFELQKQFWEQHGEEYETSQESESPNDEKE